MKQPPYKKSPQISRKSQRVATEVKPQRPTGAVTARTGMGDRWHSWLGHHREMAVESLRRFFATPIASGMTALVIAIALALPAALQLGLANFQRAVAGWDGQPQISVFLHMDITEDRAEAFADTLRAELDVAEVTYISPEEALLEFQQAAGLGDALAGLDSNPLPAVLLLRPRDTEAESLEALAERLRESALVDAVVLDMAWVQRLARLTELGRRLSAGLAALLALGVVLVVVNTIRLHIENRREEILVAKLVGGTDAFVRRPFLYSGLCYGFFGGLLAWLLVAVAVALLSGPVAGLSSTYGSGYTLQGPGYRYLLGLTVGAALLGLTGAWLAVARHIQAIEPR
ncbi:cell division transport system permease protein [Microbulbifer thermotolerans]|uniref:permease-like cell division protein FtsX n=1 Tax=Microbulbifer thermotolerans TaxID=252514 RepID=UPI0008E9DBD8|nr:permease-like cell division protein FtsX [Microbulbifer thermotolerans]SFC13098.1 cell division transport system permease protein [Microbulbifer thermotolerans]